MGTQWASNFRMALYLFLVSSSFGFLQPFLPLYMEAAHISRAQIGVITGLGIGIALLVQPLLGRLSDRLDARRPFICLSALFAFFAYTAVPHARHYGEFLALVALGANGTMYLNAAGGVLIGRMVQKSKGGTAYAALRVWGSVGYIVTALVTGILVFRRAGAALDRAALGPVFQYGPVLFLVVAALAWTLPDSKSVTQDPEANTKAPLPPNLRRFLTAYFFYTFALYGASSFLSLFLKSLGAKGIMISAAFAVGVLVEVFVMRWSGRFSDQYGRRPALAISFLLLPIRLLLYVPATGPAWVFFVQALHGINFGIMGAVAVVFVNDLATDNTRGHAQARLFAVAGLATAVGPLLFGAIAQAYGLPMMFVAAAGIAVIGAALFMVGVQDSHPASESLADIAPTRLKRAVGWLDGPPHTTPK